MVMVQYCFYIIIIPFYVLFLHLEHIFRIMEIIKRKLKIHEKLFDPFCLMNNFVTLVHYLFQHY